MIPYFKGTASGTKTPIPWSAVGTRYEYNYWLWVVHGMNMNTVGSRLSVSGHLDVGSGRHVFGTSGKKTLRSLKFCYRRKQSCCTNDFPERYNPFFPCSIRDLDRSVAN